METTGAFADFSKEIWFELVRRHQGIVHLGSPPVEFDLTLVTCGNPACTCEDVTL